MTDLPAAAITAAELAIADEWAAGQLKPRAFAEAALEAAAPHITAAVTAAERERCVQLAESFKARYWAHKDGQQGTYHPFADLLREDTP